MSEFQLFIDSIKSDSDGEIENRFKIEFLEMKDKDLWRSLHHACRYGRVGLVKLLLSYHCDMYSCTNNGYQPIHLACENGHIDIVKILIDNKSVINKKDKIWGFQPIHLACMHGHIDIVKILIDNKCDINSSIYLECQPIHLACMNGHIDIVKILIDNNCDINASDKIWGYQPIHLACMRGHIDIVKLLIDNKCDINASDKIYDCRPIHLALLSGHYDIVKILIENDCDINALSKYDESPIDIAVEGWHHEVINILDIANIRSVARAIDLKCAINCDHQFCLTTLEGNKLPKGELIGSGAFGKIYKHKISNTNREIAVKKITNVSLDRKNIEGNINKFSSRLMHRNIVRYFGALGKYENFYIFMEYMPGGSLKELIDSTGMIENYKVIKFSKQILQGLQFIHSQGIIHRDIKPENMLLDRDKTLKLSDFGISSSLLIDSFHESYHRADTFCGTPNYLAPEIFSSEPYHFPADIWSTGASIIHMITGKAPYHYLRPEAIMFIIGTTRKIEYIPRQPISETMQSFIRDLLTPDQAKRPSAESLLKHSIFKSVN